MFRRFQREPAKGLGLLLLAAGFLLVAGGASPAKAQSNQGIPADCLTELIPYPPDLDRGFIFSLPGASTCSSTVHFVDTARGTLRFLWVDAILPDSRPLPVGRVYDSQERVDPGLAARWMQADFGPGWRQYPGAALLMMPGSEEMVLYPDDDEPISFLRRRGDLYAPAPSFRDADWQSLLALSDGTVEVRSGTGEIRRFTASPEPGLYLLAEIEDPAGHRMKFLRRDGRLERIETENGDFVEFSREPIPSLGSVRLTTSSRVQRMTDSLGHSVLFYYDGEDRLVATVTVDSERFVLDHDRQGRLVSVRHETDVPVLSVSYQADGHVSDLRAKGEAWRYHYDPSGTRAVVESRAGREQVRIEHATPPGPVPRARSTRRPTSPEDPGYDLQEVEYTENPCDGFCEAEFSGSTCLGCFGGGGDGGRGGGGGGGGDTCSFSLSVSPASALIGEPFGFTVSRGQGCSGSTSWNTQEAQGVCSTGSDVCTTSYSTPGSKTVTATVDSSSQSRTVTVIAPPCTLGISGSTSPVVGDAQTYTATGTCQRINWGVNGVACYSSTTGSSFTPTFGAVGPVEVVADGDNGFGTTTVVVQNVNVQSCSISISGPSSGAAGSLLCFGALPSTTGIYTWTADGAFAGGGSSLCVSFSTPGTHTVGVSLTKTGCGSVSCGSAAKSVTINAPPPAVQITATDPTALILGQSVTIAADGRDGFGDPTAGTYAWTTSNASILQLTPSGSQVQVKGIGPGSATLSVSFTTSAGTASDSIQVDAQDVTLEISSTPPSYLPTDQNEVQFTATLMPPAAMNRLRVSLSDVTSFPGTSMNFGSGTESDFYFEASANPGLTISPDGLRAESATAVHSLTVTAWSRDNGGRARISAETLDFPVRMSPTRVIPLDTDGDTLPDAWESASSFFSATAADTDGDGIQDDAEDDDPTPSVSANAGPATPAGAQTGQGLTGDGLSAYEEYRGFLSLGTPIRTSPSAKDVFIHSDLTSYGIGYTSALTGFNLHEVALDEWSGVVNRLINANRDTIPGTDQAAIQIILALNQDPNGTLGQTFKTTAGVQNETPNETSRSEINLAAIQNGILPVFFPGPDGIYGTRDDDIVNSGTAYSTSEVNDVIRETIAHEAAHNLHVEHNFFYLDQLVVAVGDGSLAGNVMEGPDAVAPGADGICQTTAAAGDVQTTPLGQTGAVCVRTGQDGIANTAADPNDSQLISVNQGLPNKVCICQGEDGVLATTASGDDFPATSTNPKCGSAIASGPNGICESFPPTGTRRTIMTSELFRPVPSSYDHIDLGQVRIHVKHP